MGGNNDLYTQNKYKRKKQRSQMLLSVLIQKLEFWSQKCSEIGILFPEMETRPVQRN